MNAQYFVDRNGSFRDWIMYSLTGIMIGGMVLACVHGRYYTGMSFGMMIATLLIALHEIPAMRNKVQFLKDIMSITAKLFDQKYHKYELKSEKFQMRLAFCIFSFGFLVGAVNFVWSIII